MDYILLVNISPSGSGISTKSLNSSILYTSFPGNSDVETYVQEVKDLFSNLFSTGASVRSVSIDPPTRHEDGYFLQISLHSSGGPGELIYNKFFTSRPGSEDIETVASDARLLFSDLYNISSTGEAYDLVYVFGS